MIAGLVLTLGCQQKLKLEDAPRSITVNSAGEIFEAMNGFGTNYTNPNIRHIYLPEHHALEMRHDIDHDGIKDIAFRAGDIAYHREEPQQIYYGLHSSELSDLARKEYRKEVGELLRKNAGMNPEAYGIQLNEIKLNCPLRLHKHIPDFDGI